MMKLAPLVKKLRRFGRDEQATITVELVIIMPVLFLWFVGSIVFFNAYHAKGQAQRSNHTIAEILSRYETVNNAFLDEMADLQAQLLPGVDDFNLRVSSVNYCGAELNVDWSYATGSPMFDNNPLLDGDIVPEVFPLMSDCESVILVETNVHYVPLSDILGIVAQDWTTKTAISPRFAAALINTDI